MRQAAAHHPAGRQRALTLRAASLAIVALVAPALAVFVLLSSPPAAPAFPAYQHGAIEDCETCHESAHTDRTPLSFVCFTCHADYQVVRPGDVCWTCHTPGQDMSWARTDASCLGTCHLRAPDRAYDVPFTHTVHPGGSTACTSCHSVAVSPGLSGGSAHHTIPAPRLDLITPGSGMPGASVALSGAKFSWVTLVRFGGVEAEFTVTSDTTISATVPADAVTGRVTVVGGGGVAASAADFVVLRPEPPQRPALTLAASRRALTAGGRVKLTGTLTPFDSAQLVRVVVQRRAAGSWTAAASSSRPLSSFGAYSWTFRARLPGQYRARASAAGAASPWVTFRAR